MEALLAVRAISHRQLDYLVRGGQVGVVRSHVCSGMVSADVLATAPGWSPRYVVGPAASALGAGANGSTIQALGGRVIEGWRSSTTPGALAYDPRAETTPVYRQANVARLRLELSERHWDAPQITGRWCVQPNDVVLTKLSPVHAAFVPSNARRHPVDSNVLILRGLERSAAAWAALCLNHIGYEQLLVGESGSQRRVGLGALASLRIPPVPAPMESLSARLRDVLDHESLASDALHRVRVEVIDETRTDVRPTRQLNVGAFLARDAVSHDNWLPSATVLRAEQSSLEDEAGWVGLGQLSSSHQRVRLAGEQEGARTLRLSDVGDDLFVPSNEASPSSTSTHRTLAAPLVPGEVLVSTLGSSFRAAYVDDDVPKKIFPVDSWARLRFRETPAAWALLLSTDALRSQAARLTVGSMQQFVPPQALASLRVPVPSREVLDRWQRAVERHHAQRRSLDSEWAALVSEMTNVFETVHRPFEPMRSRRKESVR